MYKRRIVILGSTGTFGLQTLQTIRENNERFEVVALVSEGNVGVLISQIKQFRPQYVYIKDEVDREIILAECKGFISADEVFFGEEGLKEISKIKNFDIVVSAMDGMVGLMPTYNFIKKRNTTVILCSREILVIAGRIIIEEAQKYKVNLITLDTPIIEKGLRFRQEIEKIILFETENPFLQFNLGEDTKLKDILKYQRKMDSKMAVNKATMIDTGYRIIENMTLFNLTLEQVEIAKCKNRKIHSEVFQKNGTIKQNICSPDAKNQISNAFSTTYINKIFEEQIEVKEICSNENDFFEKLDIENFRCLECVFKAIKGGLEAQIVLNAANEVAVSYFLEGKIGFKDIYKVISALLKSYLYNLNVRGIYDIIMIDKLARKRAEREVLRIRMN